MALKNPPSWTQGGTYTAQSDRLTAQGLFNTTGILSPTSLAVTAQVSPNMTVNVASGWAAIVSSTANNGVYQIYNDAPVVLTIATADPSNPRIDKIVATVTDGSNSVAFQVLAGTPSGSPTAPATPSDSIAIANIAVAAGATSITSGNITDLRVLSVTGLGISNIAGGAAGNVPYQTATNTTGFTAVGTSGQFLKSNGTGAPTWDGSGYVQIAAANLSATQTVTFSPTGYRKIVAEISLGTVGTFGGSVTMTVNGLGSSGNYKYYSIAPFDSTAALGGSNTATNLSPATISVSGDFYTMEITGPALGSTNKNFNLFGSNRNQIGIINTTSPITQITLAGTNAYSGQTSATMVVYGVK
jgi:hypothetical protein